MDDPPDHFEQLGDLRTSFIFVPHGDPEPLKWMAAHPGWVKFPAVMVPRPQIVPDRTEAHPSSHGEARPPEMTPASSLRPDPPELRRPDPYDPTSPAFDPVLTLRRIGYPLDGAGVTEAQWLEPFFEGPLSKPPEGILPRFMERVPEQSGKESAKDTPSWARGNPREIGETPEEYARRVMNERWGEGHSAT